VTVVLLQVCLVDDWLVFFFTNL